MKRENCVFVTEWVCKSQTLRTKRVIWGYPASSYLYSRSNQERKAKKYFINLWKVSRHTHTASSNAECEEFLDLFISFFLLVAVATSVGFTLLIDIVEEWLHRRSRWIEWHMPRNQSQLVSTGLNQSPDRLPRKKKKKRKNQNKIIKKKERYIHLEYVWFHLG